MADPDSKEKFADIEIAEWGAVFSPNVREFPATRFVIIPDGDLIRFAFGNHGPPSDGLGKRGTPVFSVAVLMSPFLALTLRDTLNKIIIETKTVQEGPSDGPR